MVRISIFKLRTVLQRKIKALVVRVQTVNLLKINTDGNF